MHTFKANYLASTIPSLLTIFRNLILSRSKLKYYDIFINFKTRNRFKL